MSKYELYMNIDKWYRKPYNIYESIFRNRTNSTRGAFGSFLF